MTESESSQPIDRQKLLAHLRNNRVSADAASFADFILRGDFDLRPDGWRMVEALRRKVAPLDRDHARSIVQAVLDAGFDKPAPKIDFQNEQIAAALNQIMTVSKGPKTIIAEAGKLQDAVATLHRELGITLPDAEDEEHFQGIDAEEQAEPQSDPFGAWQALSQAGIDPRGVFSALEAAGLDIIDTKAILEGKTNPEDWTPEAVLVSHEKWRDFGRQADRALTEIYQMLPGNEHLSYRSDPQNVVTDVRAHLTSPHDRKRPLPPMTEAQFALVFAEERRPGPLEGERAYDERIGDALNRLAIAEFNRMLQTQPKLTLAEAAAQILAQQKPSAADDDGNSKPTPMQDLIAQGQKFRGQSDQYAELITELADALANAQTTIAEDLTYQRKLEAQLQSIRDEGVNEDRPALLAELNRRAQAEFDRLFQRLREAAAEAIAQIHTNQVSAEDRPIAYYRFTEKGLEPDRPENLAPFLKRRLEKDTLRYAATALESSADNGDRYAAAQIREALGEAVKTPEDYAADESFTKLDSEATEGTKAGYQLLGHDPIATQKLIEEARRQRHHAVGNHIVTETDEGTYVKPDIVTASVGAFALSFVRDRPYRSLESERGYAERIGKALLAHAQAQLDLTGGEGTVRSRTNQATEAPAEESSRTFTLLLGTLDDETARYRAFDQTEVHISRDLYNSQGHPHRLVATIQFKENRS